MIDLTGKRFGRLKVIKSVGSNKQKSITWLCKCDCGNEKVINGAHLRDGTIKSCGCLGSEVRKAFFKKMVDNRRLESGLASMRAVIRTYKINAKSRGLKYKLTEKQFKEITQKSCHYCGIKPNNVSKHPTRFGDYIYNGIDRIDNKKDYTIDNIVPCCHICNQAKNNLTEREFEDWIKKVYKHLEVGLIAL